MKKYLTRIVLILFIINVFTVPLFAATNSSLNVILPKKSGSYMPGDSIEISWKPLSEAIQNIVLIPANKSDPMTYSIYSDKVYGYPIIFTGEFEYTFENHVIPSGSYYVGLSAPGSDGVDAKSSKKIRVENKPSLYFGTKDGEVNSVSVSPGEMVILAWEATSVERCKASSFPSNQKWKNLVPASGIKKIRVSVPTTFYLNCKNSLGEITSGFEVNTHTPERSTANIIPSTTFASYNFPLGTTQQEALFHSTSITLFNASAIQPIYYRIVTDNQPDWISTGYNTSQHMLSPNGIASIGAFADPSNVTRPGTYTWDLKLEGNFANSPLIIPITMTVTR